MSNSIEAQEFAPAVLNKLDLMRLTELSADKSVEQFNMTDKQYEMTPM